jgi:hypothetical protein
LNLDIFTIDTKFKQHTTGIIGVGRIVRCHDNNFCFNIDTAAAVEFVRDPGRLRRSAPLA